MANIEEKVENLLKEKIENIGYDLYDVEYAKEVQTKLEEAGIRVELDDRNEKIGYKIREAQLQKVPYMLVLGDKEKEAGTVGVRSRTDGDIGAMQTDEFVAKIVDEVKTFAH